ncbi:hypothetical protein LTR85_011187 [Meristemomyces frigidus]|nr:hypothetical protein LTR85_011187 [Meristemomyces frigidus]
MAKGARASSIKKNKTGLKKRVFGPVEIARSERLSAKLLALAQQPKPLRPEMEVEKEDGEEKDAGAGAKEDDHAQDQKLPVASECIFYHLLGASTDILGSDETDSLRLDIAGHDADETMDVDDTTAAAAKKKKGNGFRLERNEKPKAHKASRVQKSSHRRARNEIVFAKSGRARSKRGSKR